ncbi:Fungal-trans domain-containing protein [Mycena indigotica]|uniref:Fungal-trans domain-containing protein n=1 Tax=Mycena indigotica TaxID=2126181 RepID=A0A8H6SWQ5_9AGAR|nr:Fungal-trans domain-containing protein [Mycena indigotica]KAF7307640.1 Fungal-trans domain-containing protein [Mycena indigotica]
MVHPRLNVDAFRMPVIYVEGKKLDAIARRCQVDDVRTALLLGQSAHIRIWGKRHVNSPSLTLRFTLSFQIGARTIASSIPQRSAKDHISAILSGSQEYTTGDYQVLVAIAQYARRLEEAFSIKTTLATPEDAAASPAYPSPESSSGETDGDGSLDSDDEGVLLDENVPDRLREVARNASTNRFYGRSSSINFVKALMRVKIEATGEGIAPRVQWARPQFWGIKPWERPTEIYVPQIFPEPDLFDSLVKLYFLHVNPLTYILHAATFHRAVAAGLHLVDQKFGSVVLAVCAIGAKLSNDPRALLEGTDDWNSAGWRWWSQVRPIPKSFVQCATLHDLQLISLAAFYLGSSSTPEVCWTTIGAGLRMATDVGAHKRMRSSGDTIRSELYKRTFWTLLWSDAIMCNLLGRPRGASWKDIDLDYHAVLEGENPLVRPYAACLIKLLNIQAQVQDIIYGSKDAQYRQGMVSELDSALNQWADTIPQDLRWDPSQPDPVQMNQSAVLYTIYYHSNGFPSCYGIIVFDQVTAQIHLHRPFIQPKSPSLSATSFPSLAICWNAARSCGHVMEMQCKNGLGLLWSPHVMGAMFDSATVLLMSGFHQSRPTTDENLLRCLKVLRQYESRWHTAGQMVDILQGMLEVDKMPASLKRSRSTEDEADYVEATPINAPTQLGPIPAIEEQFYMPLRTEDLGRLPTYPQYDVDSFLFYPDAFNALQVMNANSPEQNDYGLSGASAGVDTNGWDGWTTYPNGY